MSRELIADLPGQANINDQFIPQNLPKTLGFLKKLLKTGNGDYQFGELTAEYYGIQPGTPDYINWMEELALYDKHARKIIKKAIIDAVTDKSGPLPITFNWDSTGSPQEVVVTYISSPPSYSVEIVGYPAPAKSLLASRRKKKKT